MSRGPAVLNDKLYVATLDGLLVALDLKSGGERWSSKVLDYKLGYSMTMAPLAIDGKVVVGVSGGEAGIRGFIDAYDAQTGKQVWRFWTIPGPGEPGHDTWAGDSWKTGGAPTWVTGSYDPELSLVYWGVGNPGPDWNGDVRHGDNLYSCSLVFLFIGRLGREQRKTAVVFPVHAARHARLGCDARASAFRCRGSWLQTQTNRGGESQRVLLRVGSIDG
jgi:alcohol dehydrogenase (cytochrome c)